MNDEPASSSREASGEDRVHESKGKAKEEAVVGTKKMQRPPAIEAPPPKKAAPKLQFDAITVTPPDDEREITVIPPDDERHRDEEFASSSHEASGKNRVHETKGKAKGEAVVGTKKMPRPPATTFKGPPPPLDD